MTLLILHETINDPDKNIFGTGFASFYQDLTNVPFFGDYYNYILPFLMLIVGILTLLKFQKQVSKITKSINKRKDVNKNLTKGKF
jgi:hypothetical protein